MNQSLYIAEFVDITPTPRILRTLGEIPFAAWQCLAELMDNSLDAFTEAENKGKIIETPRIDILWSSESIPPASREIVIEDNALGMDLETLQKAARAGYSSNNPIHNLGLFGMGFNIATARLGDETTFLSSTPESHEWVGIKINFEQLIKGKTFSAPIVQLPKKHPKESGTRIIVRCLNDGIFSELRRKESAIRRQLETVYTPILSKNKPVVYVQGKQLSPRPHCVWSDSRFVTRKGVRVEAIQRINRDLGETYFDTFRNRYLTEDEVIDVEIAISKGEVLPSNIVKRSRRLKGWIGIQRFADPTNFGIDFIRNGRKILMGDKLIFGYENPDTGTFVSEYPVELGSTVGGRIVGELHVDYLIPTYQKNGFDTTNRAWRLTVEAIRGAGPILPKQRKILGYDGENESPLGKLVNAYRRTDPGTKNLAIPNSLAKEYAKNFQAGDLEYKSDEKWYKVAQESDRERSEGGNYHTPVNMGNSPSDDVSSYLPDSHTKLYGDSNDDDSSSDLSPTTPIAPSIPANSQRDQLILASEKEESLSGRYSYNVAPGLEITAWRLKGEQIKVKGQRVPYHFFQDGVEVDFFYDQTHPILAEYPLSPKQLLLQGLAEKFALRDPGVSFQFAFLGLIENHLSEERINVQVLQERARSIISVIRDRLPSLLGHRFFKAKEIIQQVEADEEELAKRLLDEAPQLLDAYQELNEQAIQSLSFVSDSTIKRLIAEFPEEFLDKKLFVLPYENLKLGSDAMRARLRKDSLDRVLSYFSDVVLLLKGGRSLNKQELLRYANTLSLLEGLLD